MQGQRHVDSTVSFPPLLPITLICILETFEKFGSKDDANCYTLEFVVRFP